MRGEGREAAGGVPRGGGESLLSHGFAVPAPPEGKPRVLRPVPAPRIYEGGGPRSGRGSLSAAAGTALSVTAFAVTALPEGEPRGLRPAEFQFIFVLSIPDSFPEYNGFSK